LGYQINGITFHSKEVRKKWVFLKLVSDGRVKLYEGFLSNPEFSEQWDVNPPRVKNIYHGPDSKFFMIEKGDVFEPVPFVGFRKQIVKFFIDDEKLCEAIKKKQLKYQSIVLIVDLYNGIKEW